eukprot:TRINITY_DN30044_c0_g1_i1.p1 TRINITY_DN30044_c0_g1~~TRINITY_DN30044_c0_g1_i1.p1  ORF type:complete len:315 (+),score=57.67 TRINITY_DN30044_c0_g1_i1:151-1095(+)
MELTLIKKGSRDSDCWTNMSDVEDCDTQYWTATSESDASVSLGGAAPSERSELAASASGGRFSSATSADRAQLRPKRKFWWRLFWCCERVHKSEWLPLRSKLSKAAKQAGGILLCVKNNMVFESWICQRDKHTMPFVVLADRREVKRCIDSLERCGPFQVRHATILLGPTPKNFSDFCANRSAEEQIHHYLEIRDADAFVNEVLRDHILSSCPSQKKAKALPRGDAGCMRRLQQPEQQQREQPAWQEAYEWQGEVDSPMRSQSYKRLGSEDLAIRRSNGNHFGLLSTLYPELVGRSLTEVHHLLVSNAPATYED